MIGEIDVGAVARHPATLATGVVGIVGGVLKLPLVAALWTWLLTQAPQLFGSISIFAWTVAPEISPALANWLQPVAIVLGVVTGGKKLHSSLKKLRKKVN